jgi:hypothetical protein
MLNSETMFSTSSFTIGLSVCFKHGFSPFDLLFGGFGFVLLFGRPERVAFPDLVCCDCEQRLGRIRIY